MKELGEAFKAIFDKVGQFLDLFDLSFFISGSVAAAALFCWFLGRPPLPEFPLPHWLLLLALLIGIYALGIFCFTAGRFTRTLASRIQNWWLNSGKYGGFDKCLLDTIRGHGLDQRAFVQSYLDVAKSHPGVRGIWALYVRLWADLRKDPDSTASLSLLNRYWVMAATCDGLGVAILGWVGVGFAYTFGLGVPVHLSKYWGLALITAGIFALILCLREAARYCEYQIYELIAATSSRLNHPAA